MKTFRQYINDTENTVIVPGAYMVPRSQMPQILDQEDFKSWLKMSGYSFVEDKEFVDKMKPLQSFVDRSKVKKFTTSQIYKYPIIISQDNFILDGHHRYYAALEAKIRDLKVIKVKLNINELFKLTQVYLDEKHKN